jgi:hypothetical protein
LEHASGRFELSDELRVRRRGEAPVDNPTEQPECGERQDESADGEQRIPSRTCIARKSAAHHAHDLRMSFDPALTARPWFN